MGLDIASCHDNPGGSPITIGQPGHFDQGKINPAAIHQLSGAQG